MTRTCNKLLKNQYISNTFEFIRNTNDVPSTEMQKSLVDRLADKDELATSKLSLHQVHNVVFNWQPSFLIPHLLNELQSRIHK
ncbi:hypothetical protein A0J61_01741 [Choanephora cucurbitarum]|uniref:Uncharacterized protein n=1 Tax=Choanephora cucurbitarum TaxID=101091 RepID=A0A1C7NP07_9FUNG|nr:hypothetical protein A0J61_01741 [Choanephora cucurbitarum]